MASARPGSRPRRRLLLAGALLALPLLAACGAGNIGALSTNGSNKLTVAEISDIGSYGADGALAEARAHFRNNNFGYSAAYYKRAVEVAPGTAEAYVGLGASYDRLGRFDLSDRVYAALFKLQGGTAQYYNNLGYSYMLRGKLKDAHDNFRKARSLAPDNIVIANNLKLLAQVSTSGRA